MGRIASYLADSGTYHELTVDYVSFLYLFASCHPVSLSLSSFLYSPLYMSIDNHCIQPTESIAKILFWWEIIDLSEVVACSVWPGIGDQPGDGKTHPGV